MRDLKKHSYSKEYHDCYMEDYKKKVRYPDVKQVFLTRYYKNK